MRNVPFFGTMKQSNKTTIKQIHKQIVICIISQRLNRILKKICHLKTRCQHIKQINIPFFKCDACECVCQCVVVCSVLHKNNKIIRIFAQNHKTSKTKNSKPKIMWIKQNVLLSRTKPHNVLLTFKNRWPVSVQLSNGYTEIDTVTQSRNMDRQKKFGWRIFDLQKKKKISQILNIVFIYS